MALLLKITVHCLQENQQNNLILALFFSVSPTLQYKADPSRQSFIAFFCLLHA